MPIGILCTNAKRKDIYVHEKNHSDFINQCSVVGRLSDKAAEHAPAAHSIGADSIIEARYFAYGGFHHG